MPHAGVDIAKVVQRCPNGILVAIEVGIKDREAMVVVAAVDDRRIFLRVGAGAIVDIDVRYGNRWPVSLTVDEIEIAIVVDIERIECTHLVA